MADLFLSYARADQRRAAELAAAAQGDALTVWWDRQLVGSSDYGLTTEGQIDAAACVLVAWSRSARDSLWVRAEANEALDRGKLLQVDLDGAKPPFPFTTVHWIDFRQWGGTREQLPWPDLRAELEGRLGAEPAAGARRPDPGGVPVAIRTEPALQGFRTAAALGWAAIGTTIMVALAVLMVVRRLITAEAFAVMSVILLAVAVALLGACGWLVLRTARASRR